jgi:hypothetical protein
LREWRSALRPITTQIGAWPNCRTGSIATIGIGHMIASRTSTNISRLGLSENKLLRLHS